MKGKSSNTKSGERRQNVSRKPQDSALIFSRAPANQHRGFDAFVSIEALPGAIAASAERNNIGTDVTLTKELKWLVRRRDSVMTKRGDAKLPSYHLLPSLVRPLQCSLPDDGSLTAGLHSVRGLIWE